LLPCALRLGVDTLAGSRAQPPAEREGGAGLPAQIVWQSFASTSIGKRVLYEIEPLNNQSKAELDRRNLRGGDGSIERAGHIYGTCRVSCRPRSQTRCKCDQVALTWPLRRSINCWSVRSPASSGPGAGGSVWSGGTGTQRVTCKPIYARLDRRDFSYTWVTEQPGSTLTIGTSCCCGRQAGKNTLKSGLPNPVKLSFVVV
jgi:hypothetical protein